MDEEKNGDIEISNSFGKIRASGRVVALALMLLVSTGVLAYMIRDHDLKQSKQLQEAGEQRGKQIDLVAQQQRQLMESMDTMIYVLTLSAEERSRLKLDMPQSLRSRLINQERAR